MNIGKECFAVAGWDQKKGIWFPPNGRPYWTNRNSRGNAGPHLTDEELDEHCLSAFKRYKFDEVWYDSCNFYDDCALEKEQE